MIAVTLPNSLDAWYRVFLLKKSYSAEARQEKKGWMHAERKRPVIARQHKDSTQ